ncbi:hypothetical protein PXO_05529 [Xanthomonas oryzae pv. oryzae PXO99A]|uniref:Uncharacterized protein n=1 Tax=Xanthomonas oryzae pv. oryzae (strain PXO99A) TaxID=360094 RepID=A0A0K0GJ03_XANOP|nr:hypothetical protein PXO_05529 [Xanthomonas oryzae pv. oryzae PXO99A]
MLGVSGWISCRTSNFAKTEPLPPCMKKSWNSGSPAILRA